MKQLRKNCKIGFMSMLLAASVLCPTGASAAGKNVMCVKTNTGQYFPVVRVSMMVVPDGGSTFEIVLKDGVGEANVKSISFEKHNEDVDFNKYKEQTSGSTTIDSSKKIYLFTNTGKYLSLGKEKPQLESIDGSNMFNVVCSSITVPNVSDVYFIRTNDPDDVIASDIDEAVMAEEKLTLMTPISSEMQISGCGEAAKAIVYDANGKMVGDAPVYNGVSTVSVAHLTKGVYIVKVGNKALKFMKK